LQLLPQDAQLELIPPSLCAEYGLTSLREALLYVHRPPADARLDQLTLGRHPAQQRLAFEELLTQHMSLKRLRAAVRERRAPKLNGMAHCASAGWKHCRSNSPQLSSASSRK
jgi:ATP-dependent DNA helicase RecG